MSKILSTVRYSNGRLFGHHLKTRLNLVKYSDHHLNSGQVKVHYSDIRYQIPSVLKKILQFFLIPIMLLWCVISTKIKEGNYK